MPCRACSGGALQSATLWADSLVDERIVNLPTTTEQITEIADVIAHQPSVRWPEVISATADRIGGGPDTIRHAVTDSARRFNNDRRRVSTDNLAKVSQVRERIDSRTS